MIRCVWLMSSRSCICPSSMMWWTVWESCSVMKEWTSECWTPSDRSDTRVKDTEMKCSKQLSVELISDSVCVCFSSGSQRSCSRKLWRVSLKTTIHPILFCSCHQTTHRLSINPPVCPASEITVKAFLQQCVCVLLWGTVNYSAFTVLQPLNSDQFCWSSSVCFMASCFSIICSQCYSS